MEEIGLVTPTPFVSLVPWQAIILHHADLSYIINLSLNAI